MKKLSIVLLTTILFANINAQIKMDSDGRVLVGPDILTLTKNFQVMGSSYLSCYPASSGIYFEQYYTAPVIRPQFGNSAYLGNSGENFWRVYTYNLHYMYQFHISDLSVKDNIRSIDNALSTVCSLRGVLFDYKPELYQNSPEEKMDMLIEEGKDNIGFIAQELKEVVPKLVALNEESELYEINYVGLVPILVEAIKEQQIIIENLSNDINELKSEIASDLKSSTDVTGSISYRQVVKSLLYQNKPNPFTEHTQIEYYIPAETNLAKIYIYNMNGSQLKSYELHQGGYGAITINGSELPAGMYIYSLISDGQLIDKKQMVLTD